MRFLLGVMGILALMCLPLAATTLTFNITGAQQNEAIPQAYGAYVNSAVFGNYNYLIGPEGPTPNVFVTYGPSTQLTGVCGFDASTSCVYRYENEFGDLGSVIAQSSRGADQGKIVTTLTADPGYLVSILGFDVAAWHYLGSDLTVDSISILDGDDNVLWSVTDVTAPVDGHAHFAPGVSAPVLSLSLDASNLGYPGAENVGISNIEFSQTPEPSTWVLMGAGLVALGIRRIRR